MSNMQYKYPYQNPELTVDQRVEDLLSRMTTREKIRQLTCVMAFDGADTDPNTLNIEGGIGEIAIMGSNSEETANFVKRVQDYLKEHSRLGIPVIFHCEALSGPLIRGTQIFPTSISLGATFDPGIVEDMCERTRQQMVALGIRQALSPVVDIARDLRWGRVSETYGGDPTLCAAMGTAFVRGLQGLDIENGVAATLKHFLGYSSTQGGLNMARTNMDHREMREVFAKPFEAAIREGGVKSVMNSYSEYNGKPICASREILTDLLRDDLGFEGLVVSDYMSIERLVNCFKTAENSTDAGEQCLAAGLDVECPNPNAYDEKIADRADSGEFDIEYINRSVRRVLKLKFELGLFEDPYPRFNDLSRVMDNTENNKKSKEAAMKAMTLTKNNGILPIKNRKTKIAVIGPMGHAPRAHYACYTVPSSVEMRLGRSFDTMAGVENGNNDQQGAPSHFGNRNLPMNAADDKIREMYPDLLTTYEALAKEYEIVEYVEGCHYNDETKTDFDAAVKAAKNADVVIMTVGGRNGWGLYNTSGEGADRADITLPGSQQKLLEVVYDANPNMVIVHTDSHPLISEWAYENASAILEGWLCCTYGGVAIAKTITGENNPGGRLQMDVPRISSHGPIGHYFHNGTGFNTFPKGAINPDGYLDINNKPRRPFGYGLSYTDFEYSNFSIEMNESFDVTASVTIKNTGHAVGDEVVQIYGSDHIASIIRPEQELIGFKRITLMPGQSKTITFNFNLDQLAFKNDEGYWIIEAGDFDISFGKNSDEKLYTEKLNVPKTVNIDYTKRGFFAKCNVE